MVDNISDYPYPKDKKGLRAALEKNIAKNPKDVVSLVFLGRLMSRNPAEFQEALSKFDQALAIKPRHTDAMFWKALCLYHQYCQFDEARALCNSILNIDPNHVESLSLLSFILSNLNAPVRQTLKYARKALMLKPTWPMLRISLCKMLLYQKQDPLAAEYEIKKALQSEYETLTADNPIDSCYEQGVTGRAWTDTKETYVKFLSKIQISKAEEFIIDDDRKNKESDNKINVFRDSLKDRLSVNPNDVEALTLLGALLFEHYKQHDQAIELLKKALKLNPHNLQTKFWLATCYYADYRETDKSEPLLEEILTENPDHLASHLVLAEGQIHTSAMCNEEKADKVIQHYGHIMQMAPDWLTPRWRLIGCLLDDKEYEQARSLLDETLNITIKPPKITNEVERYYEYMITGRTWDRQKKFQPMIDWLNKHSDSSP